MTGHASKTNEKTPKWPTEYMLAMLLSVVNDLFYMEIYSKQRSLKNYQCRWKLPVPLHV